MRCYPVFLTTIGGIKINHDMEVLNQKDNPIWGLYTVGNDTGVGNRILIMPFLVGTHLLLLLTPPYRWRKCSSLCIVQLIEIRFIYLSKANFLQKSLIVYSNPAQFYIGQVE